jgi:hypothetical protein
MVAHWVTVAHNQEVLVQCFLKGTLVSSESNLNSFSELVCRNIWILILTNIFHIFIKYSDDQIKTASVMVRKTVIIQKPHDSQI